jgi:hypothetical protein
MAVVMVATLLVMAGSAGATIIERGSFSEERVDDPYTCGEGADAFDVTVAIRFDASYFLRVGKGPQAGAFLGHFDVKLYREVHTNVETGEMLVREGRGLFQEIRAVRVEGTVFQFTEVFAGPITVRDADGNLIARDRGSIHWTYRFDTRGDDEPGGDADTIVDLGTIHHGKYPIGDLDYCALLAG